MIKNQKQVSITKEKLAELKKAKSEFEKKLAEQQQTSKYKLGIKSFDSLISDLEHQLSQYESLTKGNFHCFQPKSLNEISDILIAARLAQKMSQKQLGDLVGLKEQQIQRYESTDYETASWPRIIEISEALELKFKIEKIIIINSNKENDFDYPPGITHEQVELAIQTIKVRGSLII